MTSPMLRAIAVVAGCVLAPFAARNRARVVESRFSCAGRRADGTCSERAARREELAVRVAWDMAAARIPHPVARNPRRRDIDFAWFGERWFFDNFDLGFELFDHPGFTTNIVARLNSDQVFFGKTNTRYVNFSIGANGTQGAVATPPGTDSSVPLELKVPHRDFAVELGVETLLDGSWGQATLRAFPRRQQYARRGMKFRPTTVTAGTAAGLSSRHPWRGVQRAPGSTITTGACTRTRCVRRCRDIGWTPHRTASRGARNLLPHEERTAGALREL